MVTNDNLQKMNLSTVKINHLFYAMTFFIQKFNDIKITEYLFKIFFSAKLHDSLKVANKNFLLDPIEYSYDFENRDIVSKIFIWVEFEKNFEIL